MKDIIVIQPKARSIDGGTIDLRKRSNNINEIDAESFFEACLQHKAEFWGVYYKTKNGETMHIMNVGKREEAQEIKDAIDLMLIEHGVIFPWELEASTSMEGIPVLLLRKHGVTNMVAAVPEEDLKQSGYFYSHLGEKVTVPNDIINQWIESAKNKPL